MQNIIFLTPQLQNYIWGGNKLNENYNKTATFPIGESIEYSPDIFSSKQLPFLPPQIIIKLICAKENLSVQLHPNNEMAKKLEKTAIGKTESWYILHADKNAGIYIGFKNNMTKKEIKELAENGKIIESMNFAQCKNGDFFHIPAGTVHAIGKGVTLYEIQQNSAITYRLFDYFRLDSLGLPRQLHLKKGISAITTKKHELPTQQCNNIENKLETVFSCEHYALKKAEINTQNNNTYIEIEISKPTILTNISGEVFLIDSFSHSKTLQDNSSSATFQKNLIHTTSSLIKQGDSIAVLTPCFINLSGKGILLFATE